MRKKGFTLIELLVVIAIIAMLLAILMPALNKVKKIAQRVVCGTNLKGLGTAQTVYANDYDDEFAIQGAGGAHTWADNTHMWQKPEKVWRTDVGPISLGASLYLLVREADVSPKSYICPSSDQQEFEGKNDFNYDIVELWDFGHKLFAEAPEQNPMNCVSYAYHNPYNGTASTGAKGRFAPDGGRSASFAMMADRSPFIDEKLENGGLASDYSNYKDVATLVGGGTAPTAGTYEDIDRKLVQVNNSEAHEREGQNVLFGDGHSSYETRADVGVNHDNIYTTWTGTGSTEAERRRGAFPGKGKVLATAFIPQGSDDSVLVNDALEMNID
jgi:prepilin-type N-terminal cleavage/methylation domain-containing protein